MKFEIRSARVEDREAIKQIYCDLVGSPVKDEGIWDHLLHAEGLVVAQADGKIVGFGGIDVLATEQVKWIYLLPQYQRSGLGSKILTRLENIGWQAGLDSLRLHSAPGAVEFYRRHGYEPVKRDQQVSHDHDGVEMVKSQLRRK